MELKVLYKVLGLIKASTWRKASRCKSLIKQLRLRLMIQKNRRNAIARQLRADIAHLLQNGQHKVAMARVAQLYKDQCTLSAYDQLEEFCDCIYTNCQNISSYRNFSGDTREAVSSLIFAASRCGELPELHLLRKLFTRQFGHEFERENVELLPGNTVNSQIKQKLTRSSVTQDMKIQLINEIMNEQIQYLEPPVKEQCLVPEVDTLSLSNHYQDGPVRHVWSNVSEDNCITEKCNTIEVQKNSHRDSSWRIASNNLCSGHQTAIGSLDDLNEQSWSREDRHGGHVLVTLPLWVEKLSSMIYMKKKTTNGRCNSTIKNDVKNATSNRSLVAYNSHNQPSVKGKEEGHISQTSHIHPKLPDYDEVVAKFKDLKEEYMQQNSNSRALHKWMRW